MVPFCRSGRGLVALPPVGTAVQVDHFGVVDDPIYHRGSDRLACCPLVVPVFEFVLLDLAGLMVGLADHPHRRDKGLGGSGN